MTEIMVVDDDHDLRESMAEVLGKAAALLKQVGPQLVHLRMLLQGMNVPIDRYAMYAARRFRREHWQLHCDVVARAIRELSGLDG